MVLEMVRTKTAQPGDIVVVMGAGRSGRAAVRLLLRQKATIRLLEKDPGNIPQDFLREIEAAGVEIHSGTPCAADFAGAKFVILSPAVPLARVTPLLPVSGGPEVLAETEFAWRCLSGEPVLAVTGTSGKTTTVSLAAAMLEAQGFRVFLGGNIGTPLSEYILDGERADVLVLEVSSFQLQTCSTFCPKVGVILNISPNHLDFHKDMAEYIDAKFRMFRCQDESDVAVLGADLRELAEQHHVLSQKVWIDPAPERFEKSLLFGAHNKINMEAAWLAVRTFGVTPENAARAVAAFRPLPNRLERVDEQGGVLFINDSKATTVSALKVALAAFDRPVVLLCGGKFKGGDLKELDPLIRRHVKAVAGFGAAREHFEPAWKDLVPLTWHEDLESAVRHAVNVADSGDVILLSPATASFDQYTSYIARGEDFKRIVGSL